LRTAIVIAGGWSVSQYDVSDLRGLDRIVVGVNESAVLAQCDVAITMDRLWAEHRWHKYFTMRTGDLWIRRGADKALPQHPRRRQFECDHESFNMSDVLGILNGTNSAMCALNHVFHRRPQHVYLFGFDMQRGPRGEPYWHKPYEWRPEGATKPGKYRDWVPQFDCIAHQFRKRGIVVKQVNNRSKIQAFEQIEYKQFAAEIG
jgi:hypothetical protein